MKNDADIRRTRESRLEKAFDLACYILGDGELSSQVAMNSVLRLETVARAQDRRFYYTPTGRSAGSQSHGIRARNLIILNEHHLLQSIIYDETEKHEKLIESSQKSIDEKRFLVHFIKHLVKITLKHNSFYVTLGLSRLLFNYSTAEAAEIYNLIIQDPSRVKDDYYWRSRKARLMNQIKDRFGPLLQVTRVSKGEERFVSDPESADKYQLVRESLEKFMPWGSGCPLPQGRSPIDGEIESLAFRGGDPDDEHGIEISRIHALMHGECFERIVAGLNYDPPIERLELPRFFNDDDRGDRKQVEANMEQREIKELSRRIDEYHSTRDQADPEELRILVNGREYCTLSPVESKRIDLDLDDDADMIEVRTVPEEGNLLLATHYIDYGILTTAKEPIEYSTRLKRGQKVTFFVEPARESVDERLHFRIGVGYRETNPLRAARLEWRRLSRTIGVSDPGLSQALRFALPAAMAAFTIGGVWLYIDQMDRNDESFIAANEEPAKDILPPIPAPVEEATDSRAKKPEPPRAAGTPGARRTIPPGEIITRSAAAAGARSFSEIGSIFIKITGQTEEEKQIAELIDRELRAAGRWEIATGDEADAALMVEPLKGDGRFRVRLIDENAETIWPDKGARIYTGTLEEIARRIVADLISAGGK